MSCRKYSLCRPNDFIYDPLFTVSSKKDYYRSGYASKLSQNTSYKVRPIFSNMFSELPNHPSAHYITKHDVSFPPFEIKQETTNPADLEVKGANRYKYFQIGSISTSTEDEGVATSRKSDRIEIPKPTHDTKETQTIYRESSAQTHPWQPDYKIIGDKTPEILNLDFLKWGDGLPPGIHEINLIEREKVKRAWEAKLPPCTSQANINIRAKIIGLLEDTKWAYREQEIQAIQDLRLELLEQMLEELHKKSASRVEKRMKLFCDQREAERDSKLSKMRINANRKMRKLKQNYEGHNGKYKPVNIIEEFTDPTSELYMPLMRHGSHPKRCSLFLDSKNAKFKTSFTGFENMVTVPTWLDEATALKDSIYIKQMGSRLCPRETKWTTSVLEDLHKELKKKRKVEKETQADCNLRIKTSESKKENDNSELLKITITHIQSILKTQDTTQKKSEKDKCNELLNKLKETHTLLEKNKKTQFIERCEEKTLDNNAIKQDKTLTSNHGIIMNNLLTILDYELQKRMEERKRHAMHLLAKREENRKKSSKTKNIHKRLPKNKIGNFKEIIDVSQETVDMYLEDIINDGSKFITDQDVKKYIKKNVAKEQIQKQEKQSITREKKSSNTSKVESITKIEKIEHDKDKLINTKEVTYVEEKIYFEDNKADKSKKFFL